MKISSRAKNSSSISFAVSVVLHLILILGFGLWNYQKTSSNLLKIPNGHSISLGGFKTHSVSSKVVALKTRSMTKSTSNADKGALETELGQAESNSGLPELVATGPSVPSDSAGKGESSESVVLTAKQKYYLEFRNIIETKKHYPTIARMRGMEGIVVVAVSIKRNGEVYNHKIIKPSGFTSLDEATLDLIKRINVFQSFPAEFTDSEIELKFPVAYKLKG